MIALFVLKLAVGITAMWLLMPRKDVTDGFFRIQMRIVLGLAVLGILVLARQSTLPQERSSSLNRSGVSQATEGKIPDQSSSRLLSEESLKLSLQILFGVSAVAAYAGSVFWMLGRRGPGNFLIYLLAGLCGIGLVLHSMAMPTGSVSIQLLSDVSSAFVLGATLTGMLLGHWYLTTPTMSIRPLWWFAGMVAISGGLRIAVSVGGLLIHGWPSDQLLHGIWLGMRVIGGGLVPPAAAWMTVRILRFRNTQSATGVLFAALILVFMGEMTGALLERDTLLTY